MNVSFLTHPKRISGRWILVQFGDTVSQTNVLIFARINMSYLPELGGQLPPPDPPSRTPMRVFSRQPIAACVMLTRLHNMFV